MTHEEEFRAYMRAANSTSGNPDERHLSEARMIAYCRGEMPAAEHEAAQAHLVGCEPCIALFRSANDFLEPARADEKVVTATETNEAWQALLPRVPIAFLPGERDAGTTVVQADFQRPRYKMDSRITLALAATLLISFAAVGWLTWRYWQERESLRQSHEVAVQLENKQRELEQRLAQLEQNGGDQLKKEHDQRVAAEAKRDQLQTELNAAQQSGQNIPVYTTMLVDERGAQEDRRLNFASAPATLLRLIVGKPHDFPEFAIEFLDERGNTVREISGLRPAGEDDALSVLVNRATFNAGKYKLRLFGQRGKTKQQLGEYSLTVTR